jgi:glycosyltransferase involved in cell wall biosynthesis
MIEWHYNSSIRFNAYALQFGAIRGNGLQVSPHQPQLAVIIPTYNRADALVQCLWHLESQTFKDFEVVVVNDGSTDSTDEQIRSYISKSPLSLRYIRQENKGPARARNHAISMVEAPICLMIGDDIFASPTLIEKHLQLHIGCPDAAVAALGLTDWSETGQTVTPFMRWINSEGLQFNYGELLRGETPNWRHFYTSNLSLKTKILKQFPFDESFPYAAMEDIELACRIEAKHGLEMVFLTEALAFHLHPTTFLQACNRMIRVGESTEYFARLWPGKIKISQNPLKRALKRLILSIPMALPLCARLANLSIKLVCPNRLMKLVLGCYFTLGYDNQLRESQ